MKGLFTLAFALAFSLASAQPNILLIISDDLNTQIGPYTALPNHTPNLDRLAQEGTRFTRAFSQYPLCGPSRASFMSGLYPETNGVLRNNDRPGSYRKHTPSLADHPSMAGFLRKHGYFTARVSKVFHMGVPGGIERGEPGGDDPDSWDYAFNVMGPETLSAGTLELLSPTNPHYGGNFSRLIIDDESQYFQTDYVATSQAIAILESRAGKVPAGGTNKKKIKPDSPFFLAVGLVRPHVPFIAPESSFQHYPEGDMVVPEVVIGDNVPEEALRRRNEPNWGMNETQKKQVIGAYMASVHFMDQQVGRLLEALDRLNIRQETIVVFISDHGYNLGEHDSWSKVSLWEGSVRVPLIISHPDYKDRGKTNASIVELIDLYPTLAEFAGLQGKQPNILQGESLVPLMQTQEEWHDRYAYTISYGGNGGSLRTEEWRYNRWGEPARSVNEELYHHTEDPEENINLADYPRYQEVLQEQREKFDRVRRLARKE